MKCNYCGGILLERKLNKIVVEAVLECPFCKERQIYDVLIKQREDG